jgi:hypothetical protein
VRRIRLLILPLLVALASPFVVASPSFASAGVLACSPPDGLYEYYTISSVTNVNMGTNVASDYLTGPGTVGVSTSKQAVVNASMTATVAAEAGVVFAKASTSLGVTVGASWATTTTWSYSKPVPAGKTARLRMYHLGKRFVVTKRHFYGTTCSYHIMYTSTVTAPVKPGANVWNLEYR